jgi:hypothetical protein
MIAVATFADMLRWSRASAVCRGRRNDVTVESDMRCHLHPVRPADTAEPHAGQCAGENALFVLLPKQQGRMRAVVSSRPGINRIPRSSNEYDRLRTEAQVTPGQLS